MGITSRIIHRERPKTLTPVRPNLGIGAAYQRRLDALLAEMHRSVLYWIAAAYRRDPPEMAADDSPARGLADTVRALARRWQQRFNALAPDLAAYFATEATQRADGALQSALRKAGFTVQLRMTPAANDILQATTQQNVALIRSISSEHFTQIQGAVMRSVQAGRDLGSLTKELQEQYGVTRRRATLIATTQNNLATASIVKARQVELGIKEAIWLHSGGGKVPRASHVKMSGNRYDVAKGMWDPDEQAWIQPGELINCRCVCRSIVPGLG